MSHRHEWKRKVAQGVDASPDDAMARRKASQARARRGSAANAGGGMAAPSTPGGAGKPGALGGSDPFSPLSTDFNGNEVKASADIKELVTSLGGAKGGRLAPLDASSERRMSEQGAEPLDSSSERRMSEQGSDALRGETGFL